MNTTIYKHKQMLPPARKPRKPLLSTILCLLLSIGTLANNGTESLYVKDGVYGLTRLQAPDYQENTLLTPITIALSPNIQTRGEALKEVLSDSGFSLAKPKAIPATDKTEHDLLFSQKLPSTLRKLGPINLGQAIQTIIGHSWQYNVDPVTQQISVSIKPEQVNYANLRANLIDRGIISDQNAGNVWSSKKYIIRFRPGSDDILNPAELYDAIKDYNNNKKRVQSIQVVGRSHSQEDGAKKNLAISRSNTVGLKLIENGISENIISMTQSILNHQPRQVSDALITIETASLPANRLIPHTQLEHSNQQRNETPIDNINPNCRTFIILEGSLKSSIERALVDCGFSIGHWGIREANGDIGDLLITKAYSFTTADLIGFLDVISNVYDIHSNINTLDRTVDFKQEKLSD